MKKLQQTMDKITTLISSILCAAMMIILFASVVLRLIPSVGGFKWYMESSQYLNVWSMLIACIGINAMGTNLRVEVVDSIFGKTALGKKLVVFIRLHCADDRLPSAYYSSHCPDACLSLKTIATPQRVW